MSESRMMEEVWRWKDEVYQDIKNMTRSERIAHFNSAARRLEEKTGIKLDLPCAERPKRGATAATSPT